MNTAHHRVDGLQRCAALLYHRWRTVVAAGLMAVFLSHGVSQNAFAQQPNNAPPPDPGMVRLNLQGEVPLKALIDLVSLRLKIRFIYGATIGNKKITVRAPEQIPVDSLLGLLSSVLRMERLVMVDADVPGWKRIVEAGEMVQLAPPGEAKEILKRDGPASPVTQVFTLQHVAADRVMTNIRPFLSISRPGVGGGANILALKESNMLVITDYAPVVVLVDRLIQLIDRPIGEFATEFYEVEHLDAEPLSQQVQGMMGESISQPGTPAAAAVLLYPEPRTNQIVVSGPAARVAQAMQLLKRFDVSLGMVTRVYRLKYVKAKRFDVLAKALVGPKDSQRLYGSSVDSEGNLVVVQTTPTLHKRLEDLAKQVDVRVQTKESPIRFYKLKNANVLDVLYSLLALQEASGTSALTGEPAATAIEMPGPFGQPYQQPYQQPRNAPRTLPAQPGGMQNNPQSRNTIRDSAVRPANFQQIQNGQYPGLPGQGAVIINPNQPFQLPLVPDETRTNPQLRRLDAFSGIGQQLATGGSATLPGGARASADVASNSLIIAAPREVQEMYRSLIESLDVRQPQVMIEAKIVAVDTSDDFALGVEVSGGDRLGVKRLFAFNSFGLSEVDPITGALQIIPSTGFNGTLVDPDVADVVIKALTSHRRARVLAAPRILVNDNATGQLESVNSIPFESVNASNTVSTTSLGGNQQAGTIITATPHISEDNHLLLDFSVEFSTFQGVSSSPSLPPPRQISRIDSTVTIPDGQTVIVGGLRRMGKGATFDGLPHLENIPILRELTSAQAHETLTTSFFLFIRPLILRDDKFNDLKYVSEKATRNARIMGAYPMSRPVMMR